MQVLPRKYCLPGKNQIACIVDLWEQHLLQLRLRKFVVEGGRKVLANVKLALHLFLHRFAPLVVAWLQQFLFLVRLKDSLANQGACTPLQWLQLPND
jgi:hypothetical protein